MRLVKAGSNPSPPCERDPLRPEQEMLILSAFHCLAELSASPGGQQALVLLSSCRNHIYTFNSCAYNVEYALRGKEHNLDKVLSQLEALSLTAILSPMQRQLFSDREGKAEVLVRALGHEKAELLNRLRWIRQSLLEYMEKKTLFEERFDEVTAFIKNTLAQSLQGKLLYKEMIERRGVLDGSSQPNVARKFDYLDHCEKLVWALYNVCRTALSSLGVADRAVEPEMALQHLTTFSTAYNDLVQQQQSIYGAYLHTEIDPRFIDLFGTDWVAAWPDVLRTVRRCYNEVVDFFEIYVPVYAQEVYLKFYQEGVMNKRTVSGYLESRLSDHFVMFMDMIRSKKSPPEVKDHIGETLQRHKAKKLYSQITSNDAFLAVSADWRLLVAATVASMARVSPYLSPQGFGGLKRVIGYGSFLLLKNDDTGETIPKDDEEPVIAATAYLCEKVGGLLTDNSEIADKDPNHWFILTEAAHDKLRIQGVDLPGAVNLGSVQLKDSIVERPWAVPHDFAALKTSLPTS